MTKKTKICVQSDPKFEEALRKLKELNPGFGASVIIRSAIIIAANKNMEIGFALVESNTMEGLTNKKKAMPKEGWCEMYGGLVADGVCTIDKYETVATGHVRKVKRVMALTAFPNDVDSFKRDILGHFESLEGAEEAYKSKPLA